MKKLLLCLLAVLATLCVAFAWGWLRGSKNRGNLDFDKVSVDTVGYLFNNPKNPGCDITVEYTFVERASDHKLRDTLNAIIGTELFGSSRYARLSPTEAVQAYVASYVENYRKELERTYQLDMREHSDRNEVLAWYSYNKELKGSVQQYDKHLLCYSIYLTEYTGGAHGIYLTNYLNIDLRTLRKITLDDIFDGDYADYSEILSNLLWEQLMNDKGVRSREELEDMGYGLSGDIMPIDNFVLSADGITFYYNVYDIAPYSTGPVEITLPYRKLEGLLNEDCRVLNEVRKG